MHGKAARLKATIALAAIFLVAGCAHYRPGISHIDHGDNYKDGVDGLYDVRLYATNSMDEYGLDSAWNAIFGDSRLYTGVSGGNRGATEGEVRKRMLDAVAVTGAYLGYRFAAVYDETGSYGIFHPRQAEKNVTVNGPGSPVTINAAAEYDVAERYKVSFDMPAITCRVMYFNTETQLKVIRKVFNPRIYEVKDIFAKVKEQTIWG